MKTDYIDHMGSDLTIVNAARVSFDKHTDEFKEQDGKLINYLAKHNHFTPFTHCIITLRETVPIFVARQRFKHTVGFSYNEVSRRYVDSDPEFYTPQDWRGRAKTNKQGSDENIKIDILYKWEAPWHKPGTDQELTIKDAYSEHLEHCASLYSDLIKAGVAPEQARIVLPQSMYTSYYVTGSLSAWARAYNLRSKADAGWEIRQVAKQWNEIIEPLFPISWNALTNAERLPTQHEIKIPNTTTPSA